MPGGRRIGHMRDRLDSLEAVPSSKGIVSVPAIAASGTASLTVPLSPVQPDAAYVPVVGFAGLELLGTVDAVVTARTKTNVTISVKARSAVSAGGSVYVVTVR